VNVFDTNDKLRPFYEAVHGWEAAQAFNVGRKDGDLLEEPLALLESSDGVVAGPPCPPWSEQGNRAGVHDDRARVFERVVEWVVELASRGALIFFAIEHVLGILKRMFGSADRFVESVLRKLRQAVPHFCIDYVVVSVRHALPARRQRVWLRGLRKDVLLGLPMPGVLPLHALPHPKLSDVLDANVPNLRPEVNQSASQSVSEAVSQSASPPEKSCPAGSLRASADESCQLQVPHQKHREQRGRWWCSFGSVQC